MNAIVIIVALVAAFIGGIYAHTRVISALHATEARIHARIAKLEARLKEKL